MKFYFLAMFCLYSVCSFGMEKSEYISLLKTVESMPNIIIDRECFNWDMYPENIHNSFIEGVKAHVKLNEIGPKQSLPIIFEMIETGELKGQFVKSYYENAGFLTNNLTEGIKKRLRSEGGLQLGFELPGNIAFLWLKKPDDLVAPTTMDIQYFWWAYDRKHMPQIWQRWYDCWIRENSRNNARKAVKSRLIYDITGLGFHIFPYVFSCLKSGDKSMNEVLAPFKTGIRFPRITCDSVEWWSANSNKYLLAAPDGYQRIDKALSEGGLCLDNDVKRLMPVWREDAENYYKNPSKNYWYDFLPNEDDISEIEIREAIIKSLSH